MRSIAVPTVYGAFITATLVVVLAALAQLSPKGNDTLTIPTAGVTATTLTFIVEAERSSPINRSPGSEGQCEQDLFSAVRTAYLPQNLGEHVVIELTEGICRITKPILLGSRAGPLTITGPTSGDARIIGARRHSLQRQTENVFEAIDEVTTSPGRVFLHGETYHAARHPNLNSLDPSSSFAPYLYSGEKILDRAQTVLKVDSRDKEFLALANSFEKLYVWSGGRRDWFVDISEIKEIDVVNREILLERGARYPLDKCSRYFFLAGLRHLDAPREFYYDADNKRLLIYNSDSRHALHGLEVPVAEQLIKIESSEAEITISNLHFAYTVNYLDYTYSDGYSIDSKNIERTVNSTGAVSIKDARNVTLDNIEIENAGMSAVHISGRSADNILNRIAIKNSGYHGVFIQGDALDENQRPTRNRLSNSVINGVGAIIGHGAGIDFTNTSGNSLINVSIKNSKRYGIRITGVQNESDSVKFVRNNNFLNIIIENVATDSGDAGAIYTWALGGPGAASTQNIFKDISIKNVSRHQSSYDAPPHGVYLDLQSDGQQFYDMSMANIQGLEYFAYLSKDHLLDGAQLAFSQTPPAYEMDCRSAPSL